MGKNDLQDLISEIRILRSALLDVALELDSKGQVDQSVGIRHKHAELGDVIDQLRAERLKEWTSEAENCCREIRVCSASVGQSLEAIQKSIAVSKDVTKMLGIVDKAMAKLRSLIPTVG